MLLGVFAFILFCYSYGSKVTSYNTTLYAFSYRYGFISRAFIGTIYQGLGTVFGFDMLHYDSALKFTQIITGIFFLDMFLFFMFIYKWTKSEYLKYSELLIVLMTVLTVPMFSSKYNFGRVDIYMFGFSLLGAIIIISKRCEWLLIPIVAACCMVHQGYVFMYFNIILVLLIYRVFTPEDEAAKKKNARRYGVIFALCFITGSALFLYFEFFSRTNGQSIANEIIRNASAVSYHGDYHKTLIDHEILNVDLAGAERGFHLENFIQAPFFLILVSPFLWLWYRFAKEVFKRAETTEAKIKYFFVLFGFLTLVPNYALKVDYARWTFAAATYFLVVTLALIAMEDQVIVESLREVRTLQKGHPWLVLIIPYMIVLVPFWDVYFDQVLKNLGDWVIVLIDGRFPALGLAEAVTQNAEL
ncbi:MAG: hypothetical protein K6B14_09060 [Lachnospiraceae bacterium]|nr:hypothetical protein [Lachnospiraceae bacterium]